MVRRTSQCASRECWPGSRRAVARVAWVCQCLSANSTPVRARTSSGLRDLPRQIARTSRRGQTGNLERDLEVLHSVRLGRSRLRVNSRVIRPRNQRDSQTRGSGPEPVMAELPSPLETRLAHLEVRGRSQGRRRLSVELRKPGFPSTKRLPTVLVRRRIECPMRELHRQRQTDGLARRG